MKKIELQKQISLYSLDTKDFYSFKEKSISDAMTFHQVRATQERETLVKLTKLLEKIEGGEVFRYLSAKNISRPKMQEDFLKGIKMSNIKIQHHEQEQRRLKKKLIKEISKNNFGKTRKLNPKALRPQKLVALFDSTLTRTCGIQPGKITEKLFIVRAFHYQILESIIHKGFIYEGKRFQYFTSSAGQIRTKKIVCIQTELFKKYENSITCGLTSEKINIQGGVNTNKYQAYLALINSASAKWRGFDINKAVVVPDMKTLVRAKVDVIDPKTFKIEPDVIKDLPFEHMDGAGIMLPSVSDKTFMFRAPWVKGMLTPFDFRKFAQKEGVSKITDIYGKEYDIFKDDIRIIMTKSQFKMAKYYQSWDEYKENFKKYKCEASKLNIEDIGTGANLNYQMLQTLVNISDEDLTTIAQPTIDIINTVGTNMHAMLELLGATRENPKLNPLQESLLIYPELLHDKHVREIIKNNRNKFIKEARAGKLKVNGHYTFIIPDIYAFCEWLFLGHETPKGLLKDREVYCSIFKEGELDVLRAPHLYKEHAIRKNIYTDETQEWFKTQGIYISSHDAISRILQADFDGDKALVIDDDTLVRVAKKEMEGINPLFYDMAKAEDSLISPQQIYKSLTSAYKANIGIISNDITKIWNSEKARTNREEALNAVRWLTMYNNFVID